MVEPTQKEKEDLRHLRLAVAAKRNGGYNAVMERLASRKAKFLLDARNVLVHDSGQMDPMRLVVACSRAFETEDLMQWIDTKMAGRLEAMERKAKTWPTNQQ